MESLEKLAARCWAVRQANFPPVIAWAYPAGTTAISVTGRECSLDCAHCGGVYLKGMKPLADVAGDGAGLGASCLISGGCTGQGDVPLAAHAAKLAGIKGDRRFNLHIGLADDAAIEAVAPLADVVSFDFVGDDATIREVYGLERTVADYAACYARLKARCRVVPHICIGLHGGEIRGEYRALELLKDLGADSLTFIVLTPTRGTRYADRPPPAVNEALAVIAAGRELFPAAPIHLGCMRPGGRYREALDAGAVQLGVNTIVNPTPAAVKMAAGLGLASERRGECCVL